MVQVTVDFFRTGLGVDEEEKISIWEASFKCKDSERSYLNSIEKKECHEVF
jgi:hypothetical protein